MGHFLIQWKYGIGEKAYWGQVCIKAGKAPVIAIYKVSYLLAFRLQNARNFSLLKCNKKAENVINSTFSAIVETVGLEANEPEENPLFQALFGIRPNHPESPGTET